MTTVNSSLKTLLCGVMLLAAAGTARIWASATAEKAEDGLVLHWAFGEKSGETVKDLSGNGNDGIIRGKVSRIEGVKDEAVLIEGKDGIVFCKDTESIGLSCTNITISFWLKPVQWNRDKANKLSANTIINKGWQYGYGIDPQYYGERLWFCANIEVLRQDFSAPFVFTSNQWTHVALTFDGKMVKMYKNGENVNTTKVIKTGAGNITGWTPDSDKLTSGSRLGCYWWPLQVGGMSPVVAGVDELKIYNRALTQIELMDISGRKEHVVLIDNGKARGAIILDKNAPEITMFAATEMQTYLQKVTGVKLPIKTVDDNTDALEWTDGGEMILIGESAATKNLGFDFADLKPDGFRIVSRPGILVVAGKDSRTAKPHYVQGVGSAGTLYGVYRFLELLGVRWYFPWAGELGEVLPREKDIRIDKMDIVSAPYFIARWAGVAPGMNALWLRRLGFGWTVYPASTCHSFAGWSPYQLIHPEWFALRADGSRGKNLCVSHPEVRDGIIKQAKTTFRFADPELFPDFCILENDGASAPCACPECKKKVIVAEGWFGEMSDYWAEIAVNTANAVAKDFPEHRVVIGAYNAQTRPPLKIDKLPSNVSVQIAKHRMHLWNDEVRNVFYDEIMGGWLKLKPATVSFWEYYNFDCWGAGKWFGVPGLATEMISDNLKKSKAMSEKSGIPFLGDYIFTNGRAGGADTPDRNYWMALNMYVTAKALWDPELPVKPLLEEFYRLYFGPAKEPMKAFYEKLEAVWSSGKWGRNLSYQKIGFAEYYRENWWGKNNPWEVLFTPEILLELAGYLSRAKELADKAPYKERLEMVGKQFNTTLKYARERGGKDKISAEDLEKAVAVW